MPKRPGTIYELLSDYTKKEVDLTILKLSEEEKDLLYLRYGDDLVNPKFQKLEREKTIAFYGKLIPRMKRLLANPEMKSRNRNNSKNSPNKEEFKEILIAEKIPMIENDDQEKTTESNNEKIDTIPEEESSTKQNLTLTEKDEVKDIEDEQKISQKESPRETKSLSKDDYIKILELIKTPNFSDMLKHLTTKEAIIISLKLGYVDGKYFTTESIANFLGVSKDEVIETTKKVLLLYKDTINSFIEQAISSISNESNSTDNYVFLKEKDTSSNN